MAGDYEERLFTEFEHTCRTQHPTVDVGIGTTPAPPPPPARKYAEAAVPASAPPLARKSRLPLAPAHRPARRQPPPSPAGAQQPQPAVRAVVLHAAPTNRKAGEMGRRLEEDNKGLKVVAGVCWLLQEGRRLGKAASSLVICLATPVLPGKLGISASAPRATIGIYR